MSLHRLSLPESFDVHSDDILFDGVSLRLLANTYGTPLYVYSHHALLSAIRAWKAALGERHHLFYAMKANSSKAILELFSRQGCGCDIVSGGELARALQAGVPPEQIVYSGVGKRVDEIESALRAGIRCINLESAPELERVQEVAQRLGLMAPVSFRVNPDVDAHTHPYISTGLKENKFGIDHTVAVSLYQKAVSLPNIRVIGIDCHIGSQITEIEPFVHAADKVFDLVCALKDLGIRLQHIDLGGGLGINYTGTIPATPKDLVEAIESRLRLRGLSDLRLCFEPGRHLVGPSGVLLTSVEFVKATETHTFAIVDASMTEMIRPALYQAVMPLMNVCRPQTTDSTCDVVGPVCESSDCLGKQQHFEARPGDILMMPNAGAYGMAMASNYNSRCLPAEVLVGNGNHALIRRRQSIESLSADELPLPTLE